MMSLIPHPKTSPPTTLWFEEGRPYIQASVLTGQAISFLEQSLPALTRSLGVLRVEHCKYSHETTKNGRFYLFDSCEPDDEALALSPLHLRWRANERRGSIVFREDPALSAPIRLQSCKGDALVADITLSSPWRAKALLAPPTIPTDLLTALVTAVRKVNLLTLPETRRIRCGFIANYTVPMAEDLAKTPVPIVIEGHQASKTEATSIALSEISYSLAGKRQSMSICFFLWA